VRPREEARRVTGSAAPPRDRLRGPRHRLEYAAVRGVEGVVRVLPRSFVRALGRLLGLTFYGVDRVHRRIALNNLQLAFPIRPAGERRQIARATFAHFGRVLFELLDFSLLPHQRMMSLVEFDGEDRVRLAYSQGRGVLFFTGHFGFWEQHAIVHALKFEPIGVVGRALDNPHLNGELERIRSCTGNFVIYRRGAVRRVMRTLANGHGVALLIDQHMLSADAVYVDFFDRPASTTSALAALALRTGAPVIPVFALPLAGGRYRMIYEHPVPPPQAESPEAIREFTQRCTDVLEMYVRRHPDLWLWMHRRWRDSGSGEAPGMFPAASPDPDGYELRVNNDEA
jgi:Kdo2-lipid IVA lauroyltransferase/acyltransferase